MLGPSKTCHITFLSSTAAFTIGTTVRHKLSSLCRFYLFMVWLPWHTLKANKTRIFLGVTKTATHVWTTCSNVHYCQIIHSHAFLESKLISIFLTPKVKTTFLRISHFWPQKYMPYGIFEHHCSFNFIHNFKPMYFYSAYKLFICVFLQ